MTIKIFILALSIYLIGVNADFLPERLAIIDSNKKNSAYIVRGNLPILKKKFQMRQLKGNLSALTGLQEYDLVVVSLLNFLTPQETKNRYIEEKYFDKHPDQGQYRNKIVLGSLVDPASLSPFLRKPLGTLQQYITVDDIDDFVEELREEISLSKRPKIIYIHCSAGVDRTGYVSGSYKMKHLSKSLKEVVSENLKVLKGIR